MKKMKLNLHHDDTLSFGSGERARDEIVNIIESVEDLEKAYPKVVCRSEYPPTVKFFEVPFRLNTDTPICRKPYRISRAKQDFVKKEIESMKENGIIRESSSPFASPILMVPKTNGTWRLCTDYRFVNEKTDLISWPLPNIDEIIAETGGCKVFSTVDLLKGFWQQPLTEDTKKFSAFVTPFGTYEYNVNPFGWKNSPKYFQKMMDQVLQQHREYCRWYIDDVIIFSKTRREHEKHLNKVFQSLNKAELKVNLKKSSLFESKVVFLGRTIDGRTKSTKEESVEKVRSLKEPSNVKQLQRFLGLCGHFRAFIKDFSKIARPLTKLTVKDVAFDWQKEHQEAFVELKEKITQNPVLELPDFSKDFILTTDASDLGTGAVLTQRGANEREHVIGYHSYTFNKAERNYSTYEKEMLAVLKAIDYFRTYLDGRKFSLHTDHSALKELLTTKEPKGRTARWIHRLSELDFEVIHKPGKTIGHADALSRLPQESELVSLLTVTDSHDKVWVPAEDRDRVLELYHDSPDSGGHDGIWRTYMKISKRFHWPKMRAEVTQYVKSCPSCQKNKAKFKQRTDRLCLRSNDDPPMHTVHVDFAELSKASWKNRGTRAFVVAIDRHTRFAAARAGKEDAHAVIALLSQKVFEHTKVVVSDHAKVFESKRLQEWTRERGIDLQVGSPYNPQSGGLVERLIRDLKTFMSMYPNLRGGWKAALEAAVRHHNRSRCSTIGCSPYFALNGTVPYLPADDKFGIRNKVRLVERRFSSEEENLIREKQKNAYDRRVSDKIPEFSAGDEVLVRKGLGKLSEFLGPFPVTRVEFRAGVPKRVVYVDGPTAKTAAIRNVFKFCPRGSGSLVGSVGD